MKLIETADYLAMSRQAANILSAQVILHPQSVLGLATGSTPLGIYRQLIEWYRKGDLDFSGVRSVNLDEYCGLAPDNPQSYHFYMRENFFRQINILPENTFLPNGMAADMEREGRRYDQLIADLGGIDLQLLGLGETGHIGFNEPNESFDKSTHKVRLKQRTIEDNARFFKNRSDVPQYAVTMGIRTIMQSKKILLVANGAHKAEILEKALFGPVVPSVPASILQLHPDITVVADAEAFAAVREKHGKRVTCLIRLVDIAPEVEGSRAFTEEVSRYCRVSLAHSTADYDQAKAAFGWGVSHATHLFNAMEGLHHRKPGAVGAVFDEARVRAELICDGFHIHPAVLRLAFRALGDDRTIVVSDSMRAAGLPDGVSELGGQTVYVKDGRALLRDGTIAGSTTNLRDEVRNLIRFGIPPRQVIRSVTINPAFAIGMERQIGSIEPGKDADLAVLDGGWEIRMVIAKGTALRFS